MSREPKAEPASIKRNPVWTCEARVVLITRLFGGGAKTREVDPISWLRSSAAKSALRFWWRSANAHGYSSVEALRQKESELFGTSGTFDKTGKPQGGPGALEVTTRSYLTAGAVTYDEGMGNPLSYGLFPARGTEQAPAPAKVAPAHDQNWATIKLTSGSSDEEVNKALLESLRLWLTLGGVGSRTRRGAGAIAAKSLKEAKDLGLPTSLDDLKQFLACHCKAQAVPASLAAIFSLARKRRIFLGPPQPSGEQAQIKLLSLLKDARQDRPHSDKKWGRSRWPEPNAVRLKFDPKKPWHHAPQQSDAGRYPRAALGLPIVLHFKDPAPMEPPEHQILGAIPNAAEWIKLERYSSPILLRPVQVWEKGGVKYVPVAIFTDCTLPPDARPLVTIDPKGKAKSTDVVTSFDIIGQANHTLQRIEQVFASEPGFRTL